MIMARAPRGGHVITFYSYKGGTGRSMAVANAAFVLAYQGKQVLVLDWDLEAPGLHRYFAPFLQDKELTLSEGIIEFISEYASESLRPLEVGERPSDDWSGEYDDI